LDPAPRRGAGGHRLAFLHPRTTGGVIVELVEHAGPPPAPPAANEAFNGPVGEAPEPPSVAEPG
ncbi:MAG TPA: hypothetical protein VJT67_08605, partial [Longimicrobiaceae bacterium]|nr:hypothetical protein [Longimicrobiaceae bacterium]